MYNVCFLAVLILIHSHSASKTLLNSHYCFISVALCILKYYNSLSLVLQKNTSFILPKETCVLSVLYGGASQLHHTHYCCESGHYYNGTKLREKVIAKPKTVLYSCKTD